MHLVGIFSPSFSCPKGKSLSKQSSVPGSNLIANYPTISHLSTTMTSCSSQSSHYGSGLRYQMYPTYCNNITHYWSLWLSMWAKIWYIVGESKGNLGEYKWYRYWYDQGVVCGMEVSIWVQRMWERGNKMRDVMRGVRWACILIVMQRPGVMWWVTGDRIGHCVCNDKGRG